MQHTRWELKAYIAYLYTKPGELTEQEKKALIRAEKKLVQKGKPKR